MTSKGCSRKGVAGEEGFGLLKLEAARDCVNF